MLELEGTWEEILEHASELAGRRVRVTVLPTAIVEPDWEQMTPAERFAASMDLAEELEKEMPFTPGGEETVRIIREGRAGAMYGYEPRE
jgi:hypothetical protein